MAGPCKLRSSKLGKGTQQTSMLLKRHSIIVHGATAKRGSANTAKRWKPRRLHDLGAGIMRRSLLGATAVLVLAAGFGRSAPQVTPTGFVVKLEANINAPAAKVYDALVGQIGSWWNPDHTYSHDG